MPRCSIDQQAVSYAATTLAAAIMNSVFQFYYVKVFLSRYGVSESWFHTTQIIFMIWNAINDPLFGYLQDNYSFSWVKSRRHSILYGAPLFALSFLVPWFSWGAYSAGGNWLAGWHLLGALCFYDTMFTFVLLAQCALFAEISTEHSVRVRLIQYSQVAALLGSSSVFLCEFFSTNLQNFEIFQGVCVGLAIISWTCMRYTGLTVSSDCENTASDSAPREVTGSILSQTKQIITQRNFIAFVTVNFAQIYHNVFLSNFSRIFYEKLVGTWYLSGTGRSIYYGMLTTLPQLMIILFGSLVRRVGYYRLVRCSSVSVVLLGIALYLHGMNSVSVTLFFLIDSVIGNATFSLFNLALSDIIDEDKIKHSRKLPLSSMVFGINALITKPAQSIAPMVTLAYLNRHGYEALSSPDTSPAVNSDAVTGAMFFLMTVTPCIVGVIQLLAWSMYSIRTSHITEPKYVEN